MRENTPVYRFLAYTVALLSVLSANAVDYLRDIKPVLKARCYACHGGLKQKSGLRLDTAAAIRKGTKAGPVVSPDKPVESELLARITSDNLEERMPPEGAPLKPQQIEAIRKWIAAGLPAPANEQSEVNPKDHWSFQPISQPPIPALNPESAFQNPIDLFIEAQRREHKLTANPPAPKLVLLRRVYLDLIGIPPTRDEMHAFLADESLGAYEKVVAKLLASPRYGERWGRHWMDIWRYSDWYGRRPNNEIRYSQRHIWRWRDWIIESINTDKGYDRMLTEMLAADEVAPTDLNALRATGFLGRNWYKFDRNTWLFETVERTGEGLLGLTFRCARCHDHKFDPITQKEYYQFRAFFEPHSFRTDPISPLATTEIDNGKATVLTDGLARAYDKDLDVSTYLFERGDDRRAIKDHPLNPAVPSALGATRLRITPIQLPISSYIPQLQESYRKIIEAKAQTKIDKAKQNTRKWRKQVSQLKTELANLTDNSTPAGEPLKPFLIDDFTSLNKKHWKAQSGTWEVKNGHLTQTAVGGFATLASLTNHPRNFVVRAKYRKLKPGTYRSVGFSFDHVPGVSTQDVYTSRTDGKPAGGVQAFHRIKGKQTYPRDAITTGKFEVGDLIDLEFTVKERNLTIKVNGELRLEYTLPLARQEGKFCVWNLQGNCEFHFLEIKPLARSRKDIQMALEAAMHGILIAEKQNELATAKLQEQITQWKAERVRLGVTNGNAKETAIATHQARLQQTVIEAQIKLLKATRLVDLSATDRNKKQQAVADKNLKDRLEARVHADGSYTHFKATYPATSTGRRTALARWLTNHQNPRTARVAVNHIWGRHFGKPLVASTSNFGLSGKPPTHPKLLDWLATELMEKGWRMKHLHRLIVTSAAYRQSSTSDSQASLQADADNRHLWQMNSRRMEAELVRDSMLAAASELDLAMGGPELAENLGQTSRRRSLYFRTTPDSKMQMLDLFDLANPNACYERHESVMPQQSLALLNSPLALDLSRTLARKLASEKKEAFTTAAFEWVLSRPPSKKEMSLSIKFLQTQESKLAKGGTPFTGVNASKIPAAKDSAQRARENLVLVLFNHNDFVTIR